MTPLQRLQLEQSEKRQKLNELLAVEELTDEQRGEMEALTKRMGQIEVEIRAAIVAEADPEPRQTKDDGENKEIREIRSKVSVLDYVDAATEMRAVGGAAAEYNAAMKMGLDRFPLDLLAPEERAVTGTDAQVTQTGWLDRLFASTAATRLGISMRSVPSGVASYPITNTGPSAAQRAKEQAIGDAAWTVSTTEMRPTRNGVRILFTLEDSARLPGLEDALRRDLGMALTEGVDRAIFLGDSGATGTAADITGLTTAAITETTIAQAAKIKGPETLAAFVNLVDGIHAGSVGDLNVVAAIGAYRLWEQTIVNAAAENQTLAAFLRTAGLSWSSRGEIETATAAGDFGAFIGRRRGIEGAAIAGIWDSGQLIRDPYSGAAKGEVALTLNYLWNFALPRPASFSRIKFVA